MTRFKTALTFAAAVAITGALAAPAVAAPDARITFSGGSVAFIAGVNWGNGTLTYHGKRIALRVSGLTVGSIGASHYQATGEVYHLHHLRDIEGTYGSVEASATGGVGGGGIDMKNDKGVEIVAHSESSGLKLNLGPGGVVIHIK
jgi:hypothetical protein